MERIRDVQSMEEMHRLLDYLPLPLSQELVNACMSRMSDLLLRECMPSVQDEVSLQKGGGRQSREGDDKEEDEDDTTEEVTSPPLMPSHYNVLGIRSKKVKKFQTKGMEFKVKFKDVPVTAAKGDEMFAWVNDAFEQLLGEVLQGIPDRDQVGMTFQNDSLQKVVWLPFMRKEDLTLERVMTRMEKTVQSQEDFMLDSSFVVTLTHVTMPQGSGRGAVPRHNFEGWMKEKRCFIKILAKDEQLCCARAIVTARAHRMRQMGHEFPQWESMRKGGGIQIQQAKELHKNAGVPEGPCDIENLKKFQAVLPEYQLKVLSKDVFNSFIYCGPEAKEKLYLYHHDNHYDVITSMPSFLERAYFCDSCNRGYNTEEDHNCRGDFCSCCFQRTPCVMEKWISCKECNRYLKNPQCYDNHKRPTPIKTVQKGGHCKHVGGQSVCDKVKRCHCGKVIHERNRHGKRPHICGEMYCRMCKDYFSEGHRCYMQPLSLPGEKLKESTKIQEMIGVENEEETLLIGKSGTRKRQHFFDVTDDEEEDEIQHGDEEEDKRLSFIFFDFECTQDLPYEGRDLKKKKRKKEQKVEEEMVYVHEPNLVVAQKVCEACLNVEDNVSQCIYCGPRENVFRGSRTKEDFCDWLFSGKHEGSICLCHNFRGYDSYFILQYCYDQVMLPELVMNGAKVMCMEVGGLKFKDSLNFLPMPLAKLPKMFDMKELCKGYFPHLFNTKENQTYVGSMPPIATYDPDSLKENERNNFYNWYQEQLEKNYVFDFEKEILQYCRSDVDILRRCCLKFRDLFINTTGVDPFHSCITIASACNRVYRSKFLKEDTIAIIPPQGYRPKDRHSLAAIRWLKWLSHKHGIEIKHARNHGEQRVGPYKVDGMYGKTVFEFYGCLWHGHPLCFKEREKNIPGSSLTVEDAFQHTLQRKEYLEKAGYVLEEIWECEYHRLLKTDPEMKVFVESVSIVDILDPREAFFGGRTNATRLFYEVPEGGKQQIRYRDVCSLYPWVCKYGKFPIGHPAVITENFGELDLYEGLVKCKVLPPSNLYHPVLPYRCNGKLLFPLCRTCVEAQIRDPGYKCSHNEDERALRGTWVTLELKKARQMGYIVLETYEVWHFAETEQYDPSTKSGGLFTPYIDLFLKLKQEASGWPSECGNDLLERKRYVSNYLTKEGVQLQEKHIDHNPGLRALAKLCLNSFWGKFGQRNNMEKTSYVKDPKDFYALLTQDDKVVKQVTFVNEEMIRINWVQHEDLVDVLPNTNVILAAYTMAQARLKLYSYLEMLGEDVLYFDTDSVIYKTFPERDPIKVGNFLGDMTDELESDYGTGSYITRFVSGGPKNYAFEVYSPRMERTYTTMKVRGIHLNYAVSKLVNFDLLLSMVKGTGPEKLGVKYPHFICRTTGKEKQILTRPLSKDYRLVYDKRVLHADYNTYPYGYRHY